MYRASRGFTLVELMIALFIFALLASTITLTNIQSLRTARQLDEQLQGRWVNQNVLTEMRLAESFPRSGSTDREYEYNGQTWLVDIEVQVEDSELLGSYLRHVELSSRVLGQQQYVDTLRATLGKVISL
ncbi:prepilin-type N-terminal cleavage/methylation domain-containing protein [Reinekea thalattae]|uniref:Prepilin-type N-terminal cleavage/methylation domain-containing protein n=1 Tax=Reinekea thalattae TaxID=2593301 RepID=A0A5C8Z866_9GAMM|nr:prepilin-type N-terminal cleavage/methylation domain-containing protein [Reinekea thalattae]TXR53504.1 prepilin-type N-terminal cleavage/methylation domain-containing protein [Reinekea thalattae]